MERTHKVIVPAEEGTKAAKARDQDIRVRIGEAKMKKEKEKEVEVVNALTAAADITTVRIALLRLVIFHDLPLNFPELQEARHRHGRSACCKGEEGQ